MTAETLSSETARWKARTESDDELLLSYDTISILRPRMPPLALISSAAICAPPGVAAPAIDCTSAMTPILIGSLDCAEAGATAPNATSAVVAVSNCVNLEPVRAILLLPFCSAFPAGWREVEHKAKRKSNKTAARFAA